MIIKGIKLKQTLQLLGITQEEASKRLNISRPTLSVWYNKEALSDAILDKIQESLNIDLRKESNEVTLTSENKKKDEKDELIDQLKQRLSDKDEIIALLKKQLENNGQKSAG